MPLSFVGFDWLLGGLGPLGMNGWGSRAIHGSGVCILGGLMSTIVGQDARDECVLLSPYGMLLCESGCSSLCGLL